ncbi:MAG: hypothetical protein IPK46_09295 [Saprospiraceae bacterium]|nr:hypothetical protein [Saprospiraceae bacterium]
MLNYLHLYFSLKISPHQIADFRGAFIALAMRSNMDDVALSYLDNRQYLNGEAGSLITRYPRVQFRVENGLAAIWAINEGVAVIQQMIQASLLDLFEMYGAKIPLEPAAWPKTGSMVSKVTSKKTNTYRLSYYMPFDHRSDHEYHAAPSMTDKIRILEHALTSGLAISLSELGMGETDVKKIRVQLLDIIRTETLSYKVKAGSDRNYTKVYDLLISTNVLIPDGYSLGRRKAYGFGVCIRIDSESSLKG